MARRIGRQTVNHLKELYPAALKAVPKRRGLSDEPCQERHRLGDAAVAHGDDRDAQVERRADRNGGLIQPTAGGP